MEKTGAEAEDLDSCPATQQLWDPGQASGGLRVLIHILNIIEISGMRLCPLTASGYVMTSPDSNIQQAFNVCSRNEIMCIRHAKRAQCRAFSLQWIAISYLLQTLNLSLPVNLFSQLAKQTELCTYLKENSYYQYNLL